MKKFVGLLLVSLSVCVQSSASPFSAEDIVSGAFVDHKLELRRERAERLPPVVVSDAADIFRGFQLALDPSTPVEHMLPDTTVLHNLLEIEKRNLFSGTVEKRPWTDSYWPMYKGITSARYADPQFAQLLTWKQAFDFWESHPASKLLASKDEAAIINLSPAEKYDLLVGDNQGTLAASQWNRGRYFQQTKGSVAPWMGICDGWAAASMEMPEPIHTIHLPTADGRLVTFFPSDIKALATLLWGRGTFAQHQVGGMCAQHSPATDLSGHVLDKRCFDPDPAAWHMAVVSRVGVEHKSFAFDATYDFEIWNQPIYSYSYTYFNPQTIARSSSLRDAAVPLSMFTSDRFRAYRSPGTNYVVGVIMAVTYIVGSSPSHAEGSISLTQTVNYIYDLDLDADMNMLGGEWYTNKHPDFLWSPEPKTHVVTAGDGMLGNTTWDGRGPVPQAWLEGIRKSAINEQPLTAIVERLVELSNR